MELKIAMPYLTDTLEDFGLNTKESNKAIAKNMLKRKKSSLKEDLNYDYFQVGDWASGGYLVLYNKQTQLISYLVKYTIHSSGVENFKKVVTQLAVWRSLTDNASRGMAEKVFFDFLKRYGAVMSDGLQTNDGKHFWVDRMAQAESQGYQIAFIDRNKHTFIYKKPEENLEDWLVSLNTWGKEHKNLGEKFLIFQP